MKRARAEFMRKIKQADAGFDRLFAEPEYSVELFIRHGVELINSLINAGEPDKAKYLEWFMARTLRRRARGARQERRPKPARPVSQTRL
jgi:hypothetical protein